MAFDFTVPVYLSAKSEDDLMREMARNNMKYGVNFRYFDIQWVEKRWVAWYYHDNSKLMKEKIKDLLGDESKRL